MQVSSPCITYCYQWCCCMRLRFLFWENTPNQTAFRENMGGFIGASVVTMISAFLVSPIYSTRTDGSTVSNKIFLNMMEILTLWGMRILYLWKFVYQILLYFWCSFLLCIGDPWTVEQETCSVVMSVLSLSRVTELELCWESNQVKTFSSAENT